MHVSISETRFVHFLLKTAAALYFFYSKTQEEIFKVFGGGLLSVAD